MSRGNRGIGRRGGISGRGSLVFLFILSVLLLYLTDSGSYLLGAARQLASDITVPVNNMLSRPVVGSRRIAESFFNYTRLADDNELLRQENAELLTWKDRALRLEADIKRYQTLLNIQLDDRYDFVTTRVTADIGGPFVRTVLVTAGADDGVKVGQGVIGMTGFLGRVVSTGNSSSRVLLLTDFNSRIPVQIDPYGRQAIMTGNNTGAPSLSFVSEVSDIEPGARVVTSGYGGDIPPGLTIGNVSFNRNNQPLVDLREDLSNLDYVRIVRFKSIDAPDTESQLPDTLNTQETRAE